MSRLVPLDDNFDYKKLIEELHNNIKAGIREYYGLPDYQTEESVKLVCECGAHKTNTPGHSTWCPLFEENN